MVVHPRIEVKNVMTMKFSLQPALGWDAAIIRC